jgi:hypothetical protein
MEKHGKRIIGSTWLAGNTSCTLIIPKPIAQEYGIDKPSSVIIEGTERGILITRLELDAVKSKHAVSSTNTGLVSSGDVLIT